MRYGVQDVGYRNISYDLKEERFRLKITASHLLRLFLFSWCCILQSLTWVRLPTLQKRWRQ